MARKKKHPEHVNHERWLVSYADFITLLFAFFVVMFAVSQVDSAKMGRFTQEFSKAVGIELFVKGGANILPGGESAASMEESSSSDSKGGLPSELEELRSSLAQMVEKDGKLQGLQVIVRHRDLVLRLPESIFFDSGEDSLKPGTGQVLEAIAPEIAKRKVAVQVEGHTDAVPIRNARARSNWELSALRATGVVTRLAALGVVGDRLGATGYGETRPIATNGTPEGRKQNRRVDLIVSLAQPPTPEQGEVASDVGKPTAKASTPDGGSPDGGRGATVATDAGASAPLGQSDHGGGHAGEQETAAPHAPAEGAGGHHEHEAVR